MNILFYGYTETKEFSGESTHINELLSSLAKIGHKVVSLNIGHTKDDIKSSNNLQPSVMAGKKRFLAESQIFKPIIGEIFLLLHFLREIHIFCSALIIIVKRKGKIDIIYRRHGLYNSEYLLAKLFKIPSVIEINGIAYDEIKTTIKADRVSLWIIDRIERLNMPKADKIIVVTSRLKEILILEYGVSSDKITVIQNGANTDLFKPMDAIKTRAVLGLSRSDNYICFVGTLDRWQGIDTIIKSIPSVLVHCPETQLLVVGDGPMKQELKKLAKRISVSNRVIFTGMVPYKKVPLYMNAADICTSPKSFLRSGYSPLKIYEYMACGKPVVASRVSGLEMVEESGCGILVEQQDSQAFATVITRLLENGELRKQMGENGRRYVVENQSWDSIGKMVADVCKSLIDKRRNKGEQ